jgi:membrane associated rhomboid family serine protease
MTPWVTRIIIANVVVFLFQLIFPYMFLHGGIIHILFNMWIFYIFGPRLEVRLGGRSFLALYFISGISGALLSAVTTPHAAIIGASGAVFGIELAYAMFWPRDKIYIWGVLPVEVRWLVVFLTGMSLFAGFSRRRGASSAKRPPSRPNPSHRARATWTAGAASAGTTCTR